MAASKADINWPDLLKKSWQGYKTQMLQGDGRVIDRYASHNSTSEGQSYALLRAVVVNDADTFDTVWNWTKNNLQVRGDKLFAWQWGEDKVTGQWTALDKASASDADQDIALALLLAAERWQRSDYQKEALGILNDIWLIETTSSKQGRVLLPGDWYVNLANSSSQSLLIEESSNSLFSQNNKIYAYKNKNFIPNEVLINPSYLAPYAYRYFAQVDSSHPWTELAHTSISILQQAQNISPTGLPADWISLDRDSGKVSLNAPESPQASHFGYEAIRVPYRLLLDRLLYPKSKEAPIIDGLLNSQVTALVRMWDTSQHWKRLPITLAGKATGKHETLAAHGTFLPVIFYSVKTTNKKTLTPISEHIKKQTYQGAFSNHRNLWLPENDYYAQNWLWFGGLAYYFQQVSSTKNNLKTKPPLFLYFHLLS